MINDNYKEYRLTEGEAYIVDTFRQINKKGDKQKLDFIFNMFSSVVKEGTHDALFYFFHACNICGIPYIDADVIKEYLIEHIDDKELLKEKGVL